MFHRTFALHMQATSQIRARSRLGIGPGGRVQSERNWAAACRKAGLVDAWGDRNLRAAHNYFAQCAPLLGWTERAWHTSLAQPLITSQAAALDGGARRGVVVPTARPPSTSRMRGSRLPLAGEEVLPGSLPPWRRAALAANVVTLGAALVAVAPVTLVAVMPALAEGAAFAAGAATGL